MISTAIAALMAISAATTAGAQVAGAKISSNASKRAGDQQAQAARDAEAEARRQDDLDRKQYATEYQRTVALQDAETARLEDDRRRRQALIDQFGQLRGGLTDGNPGPATLARLAPNAPTPMPREAPPMPAGWKPGTPVGPATSTPTPTPTPVPSSASASRAASSMAALAPTTPIAGSVAPPVTVGNDGSDPNLYRLPDGTRVPYVPYVNPYRRTPGSAPTLSALRSV